MPFPKTKKGATCGTVAGGSKPRPGSPITQKKGAQKKDEKTASEKRVDILERENMMLRKNLNMVEIRKEFQKSPIHESDWNSLFFESLHDLEQKLQCYESSAGAFISGSLTDLQKELETGREKIKLLENELMEKTRIINEKDRREARSDMNAQKENARHLSDPTDKLKELVLQTKCDMFEKIMNEKDEELRKARTEIEEHNVYTHVIKNQLEELKKENSRLKKDVAVRETEIQKFKNELQVIEQAKVKEEDSEHNRQQAGNTIKENTEEIARLKNDLLEIKRYCKDAFEKLDQKDKMISQLQEKLNIPTGERNPTPTTRYGAVSKTGTLQFLSR